MSPTIQGSVLAAAVAAICPDVSARIASCGDTTPTEPELWRELSCCLLSSQVPYAVAQAAAAAVERSGVLTGPATSSPGSVLEVLVAILNAPLQVGATRRRYRFPQSRARQLAATWTEVRSQAGSLSGLLQRLGSAEQARRWLIVHAQGIGPKQASMFLRNVGITYDLAVLDRHVLSYMREVGLTATTAMHVTALKPYLVLEATLSEHAASMGYPVGLLDWAIWIVMRVARRANDEVST